jgi:hypothetical protein
MRGISLVAHPGGGEVENNPSGAEAPVDKPFEHPESRSVALVTLTGTMGSFDMLPLEVGWGVVVADALGVFPFELGPGELEHPASRASSMRAEASLTFTGS